MSKDWAGGLDTTAPRQMVYAGSGAFHAELAWLGDRVAADVAIEVADGRITALRPGAPAQGTRLPGLTLPAFADAHCHAFHRALRGRTHRGGGTFWTWREDMYTVADRLDPDGYYDLARGVYAELALAGVGVVGEFHYLHHGPGGVPYDDPNAMGHALVAAAQDAGIRLVLLDTCYLTGSIDQPLEGVQRRFGDVDGEAWAARVDGLPPIAGGGTGAAVHSVRAVPPAQAEVVARWAGEHQTPLHVHLSEQQAENAACVERYGATPASVLAASGVLGARTTAVHATHLSDADQILLADSGTGVCMTPTTERDLADGIGPARDLADRGVRISLGSDSNAVVDLLEETRALELDERLRSERRGHWSADALVTALTVAGYTALGLPGGTIAPGQPADLTTVGLDSIRLAGWDTATVLESVLFAATAADVTHLVVAGEVVVADGVHRRVPDAADVLGSAVRRILSD